MSLSNKLNQLAASFAKSVLDAIRGEKLEEIVAELGSSDIIVIPDVKAAKSVKSAQVAPKKQNAPAPKKTAAPAKKSSGRLARRSDEDIASMADAIAKLCAKHPDGLRAEQIRVELDVDAKEMPRPIKYALDNGMLRTTGQKRATTYFAKGAKGSKAAPSKAKAAKVAKPVKKAKPVKAKAAKAEAPKKRGRPKGSKNAKKAETSSKNGKAAKVSKEELAAMTKIASESTSTEEAKTE